MIISAERYLPYYPLLLMHAIQRDADDDDMMMMMTASIIMATTHHGNADMMMWNCCSNTRRDVKYMIQWLSAHYIMSCSSAPCLVCTSLHEVLLHCYSKILLAIHVIVY